MKIARNKTAVSLLALVLILTFAVAIVAPVANAENVYFYTWVYVATSAGTRGVGVGETILLVSWTAEMPPDQGEATHVVNSPTGRAGWYGMQIKIWDPDNETEVKDMPYSDPVGANYISYTPTKVGTYRIQAIFPYTEKNIIVSGTIGGVTVVAGDKRIYTAAESPIATFEVYEGVTPTWPESPLPKDYWTRPISDASREWYVLAGNWLAGAANVWPQGGAGGTISNYGWGEAPESAHILWSKPFFIGGLMDERFGAINFHTSHYQGVTFSPSIVLDGKIHWTPRYETHYSKGWEVIDLYSGDTLYKDWDAAKPDMGSIYLYESPNQHGGFAYLWQTGGGGFFFGGGTPVTVPEIIRVSRSFQQQAGWLPNRTGSYQEINRTATPVQLGTVWKMIDAYTFKDVCYIANVSSSGTQVYGKDGSILYYNIVNKTVTTPNYYCTVWNSSCGTMLASQTGTGAWQWRPSGGDFGAENPYFGAASFWTPYTMTSNVVHDGNQMWWQNFSIPNIVTPPNAVLNESASIRAIREGEIMIIGTQGSYTKAGKVDGWMMGISLERGSEGTQLWKTTFTPPYLDVDKNVTAASMFTGGFQLQGVYPEEDIMVFNEVKQLKTWVYNLTTGAELWHTNDEVPQYNYYGQSQIVMDGKVIVYGSYYGVMRAYDAATGEILWTYNAENIGEESAYGNYPMIVGAVSDGKIYTYTSEHSYTHPLYRGPNLRCINATDGTEIFSILDFGGGLAIADGRLLTSNSMDNSIYCYGRGPSGTTVTASPKVSVHGTQVMIEGTVTDQTPTGRRNTNDKIDFTLKDTPAISDEDMAAWMEYKFMQQAKPADAKGVEVVLSVYDPNNNCYEIGRTTSDMEGNYGLAFEPLVPGTYQIIATFEGTASYGPSSATTYLTVEEAPAATAEPTPTPAPMTDTYVLGLGTAAIIAIVAIGIVLILMLRKR
jgi:outer membrane protein assembly factor BamB